MVKLYCDDGDCNNNGDCNDGDLNDGDCNDGDCNDGDNKNNYNNNIGCLIMHEMVTLNAPRLVVPIATALVGSMRI